jgi:hypothetical protein
VKKKRFDIPIPDLTFPTIDYGHHSIPMDLRVLLYKGAAKEKHWTVFNKIAAEEFGAPIEGRIELVQRMHSEMNASLIAGGSPETAKNIYGTIKVFFSWAESRNIDLTFESVETTYRLWTDYLLSRILKKEIAKISAYSMAINISTILSAALKKTQSLIHTTRIKYPTAKFFSAASDKQNLGEIFVFGCFLIDIVKCLHINAIYGSLPLKIELRNGMSWEEWSGLKPISDVKCLSPAYKGNKRGSSLAVATRSAYEKDYSFRTRSPLINLRLEAELLIFIAQTGMNLSQAYALKKVQFTYKSSIDGYQVLDYKLRRKGEVLFQIFSEYRDHFDSYLNWRKNIFGDTSDLLFPFIRQGGSPTSLPQFAKIRQKCQQVKLPFYCPQELRKTKLNWYHRKSADAALTAEEAQHSKEVLYRHYLQPNFQVAKIEIIQFLMKSDPALNRGEMGPAPAPGICNGIPAGIPEISPDSPKPDCTNPGGCLFCQHHRDIDSEDYVWSIASMKHLNSLIIAGYPPLEKNKPDLGSHVALVLEILVAKLKWFEASNDRRKEWVIEAIERCSEGAFHPHWGYLIESLDT